MAQRPLYTVKIIATGETVEVWKHGTRNEYVNYVDATTVYQPDELDLKTLKEKK